VWQLRDAQPSRDLLREQGDQEVALRRWSAHGLALWGVMVLLAALGGYVGSRAVVPSNAFLIATTALGGAAAGLVLFVMPQEAWRLIRMASIHFTLWGRRRVLRELVFAERGRLAGQARETRDPRALSDLAVTEYLLGNHETAEQHAAHALERAPDNAAFANNMGVVLARQGHTLRAAELFVQASGAEGVEAARVNWALAAPLLPNAELLHQVMPKTGDRPGALVLNNIGVFHAHRGNWDLAREWFLLAHRADPHLATAVANLGLVAHQAGLLQEAVDRLSEAQRMDPREPAIAALLGVTLAAAGQVERGRALLRRAQQAYPGNAGIRINALLLDAQAGQRAAAVRGLRAVAAGASHSRDAHYNMAAIMLADGESAAAASAASAAIEEGDNSAEAYTVLAMALWHLGRRAEALSHFVSASAVPQAGAVAGSNLCRAMLLAGHADRALSGIQAASVRWPDEPTIAFDLTVSGLAACAEKFMKGIPPLERQAFFTELHGWLPGLEAAVRRGGETAAEAHLNLGLYLYMREERELAIEQFEAALRLAPQATQIHFLLGTTLAQTAQTMTQELEEGVLTSTPEGVEVLRRAARHLEQATKASGAPIDALFNLGCVLYSLEEYEQALEVFRRALRIENSEVMNTMAALAAAKQARSWQNALRTQMLMAEGRREYLAARTAQLLDAAVHYFRQALMRNELNAVSHGNMGLAYMLRNQEHDVEAALHHWQRMRAIAGVAMAKRYAQLTQIDGTAQAARIHFDDHEVSPRSIDVYHWIAVPAPRASGVRYITEPLTVQRPWRLETTSEPLRRALALRDQIAQRELALARLRV
jgi:tetratricopeptide (TPR) repeat protein